MTPEDHVLGACMWSPEAIRFASNILIPEDFYYPINQGMFRAILRLHADGEPVEPGSVFLKMQEMGVVIPAGVTSATIVQIWMDTTSPETVGFYAEQVKRASAKHGLHMTAVRLKQMADDPSVDPALAAQAAQESIRNLFANGPQRMTTKTLTEVLSIEQDHDWLIPRLLEKGDRVIITGYEGGGKTTWVRQMVICMAAGIHPTTFDRLERPLTVLVVDAENTETQWRHEVREMVRKVWRMAGINPADRIHLTAGKRLDVTKDATLGEIHRLVDEHEPDVVAIGPLYRLVSTGINDDREAAPVITALDSLRDRGLALIMEAHSPKGNVQSGARDMSPRGSAALMGWPEFGLGMVPDSEDPRLTKVTRWRGDRDARRDWPVDLYRGGILPWTADTVSRGAQNNINNMQAQDHFATYN